MQRTNLKERQRTIRKGFNKRRQPDLLKQIGEL